MAKIFLCYAKIDKEEVENLYNKLSEAGFDPWMDTKNILGGQNTSLAINGAIRHSDLFLACLTDNSVNNEGVFHSEIKDALDIQRQKLEGDIYIIPVLLENCNMPHSLRDIQSVNLFEEGGWIKLIKSIKSIQEKIRQIAEQQEKVKWVLVLSATVDQINKQKVEAIVKHLRSLTNDTELTLLRIESGSVIIYLESSQKGFKKIVSLFEDGQISTIQNFIVEDIVLQSKFNINISESKIIVNRIEQINEFKKQLDSIRSGNRFSNTIFEWYGIPGVGKTARAQISISELCGNMGIQFACIDFNTEINENANRYFYDNSLLIADILKRICQSKKSLGYTVDTILHYVRNLSASNPVVIHFDTTEEIKPTFFIWLEKNIISPLCLTGKCLIIWTGRYPQQWKRFEVRQRVVSGRLSSFSREATIRQVGQTDIDIYQVTFGHPMGNEQLSKIITDLKRKKESFGEIDMINAVNNSIIDKYVMENIPSEINSAFRVMSIVRQFDVNMLRRILSQFVEHFVKTDNFLKVIRQFNETSLIEWHSVRRKGYIIDATIRQILAKHLQLNQQEKYLAINELAAIIYEEWLSKVSENRSIYVVERLYHLANIANSRKKDQSQIAAKLQNELKGYLQKYYNKDESNVAFSAANRLYQELEEDKDIEKIIGEQGFAELKKAVTSTV